MPLFMRACRGRGPAHCSVGVRCLPRRGRYSGARHLFELQVVDGEASRLPTAATCFNTLRLPWYTSEQQLRDRLMVAMAGAGGFDEGAVAV